MLDSIISINQKKITDSKNDEEKMKTLTLKLEVMIMFLEHGLHLPDKYSKIELERRIDESIQYLPSDWEPGFVYSDFDLMGKILEEGGPASKRFFVWRFAQMSNPKSNPGHQMVSLILKLYQK